MKNMEELTEDEIQALAEDLTRDSEWQIRVNLAERLAQVSERLRGLDRHLNELARKVNRHDSNINDASYPLREINGMLNDVSEVFDFLHKTAKDSV